ncbi:MAG: GTPase HflX [Deltaproteobacteria bacterium]|nr:GTPase HflX [Deltaproteobacteria bacterium]
MQRIYGSIKGFRASEINALERLYRRKVPPDSVVTHELCTEMARLSRQVGIQIGLLINRGGAVEYVIAGRATGITIPKLNRGRTHPGRLQGLRLIHTHLNNEELSYEDLTDLAMLRLDLVYAITVSNTGEPLLAYGGHLVPKNSLSGVWQVLKPVPTHRITIPFDRFIKDLEERITRSHSYQKVDTDEDRGIIVAIFPKLSEDSRIRLAEFEDLARSANINVLDTVVQKRPKPDPKFVVGKGKLSQIVINALAIDANLLIFNHELSPSQARAISDFTDLRVIDRTQLILDIFARRAKTKEGKIQVELAQLKYNMPRLVGARPTLSRLAGGIGTRGPGETKLEIDRRRAKERISRLEHEISRISKKRKLTRQKRNKNSTPIISIIGYTNSGKSTLLNTLTKSDVLVANMPFATLDPSSKRLRFPRDIDVVITDTVGFLRELPNELKAAFMATLEELAEADLLLEIADLTDPNIEDKIQAVESILKDLNLDTKPRMKVFNKADKCDLSIAESLSNRYKGVAISAINKSSLPPLIERMQKFFI